MILSALSSALPYMAAAWQVGSQYLTKPKKEDYVPTGSMYQRYLAHLKSQTSESKVYHQRMRPALRQIGQQTQKAQRGVDYFTASRKPGGGVEAQMRMGINRQALEAIGIASEKASVAQEQINVRTGEQLLRIGVQEEQALQRYQTAKKDWTKRMFATSVSAGINLADVSVKKHIADTKLKLDAAKDAKEASDAFTASYESAKAALTIPQGTTIEQYQDMIDTSGYEDPDMMNKYLKSIGAQKAKDIKFQKSEQLEAVKTSSADALIQFTKHAAEFPGSGFDFLEETGYMDYMTSADRIKAAKIAQSNMPEVADKTKPFEKEIMLAGAMHNYQGLKTLANKVFLDKNASPAHIQMVGKKMDTELRRKAELTDETDKIKTKELKFDYNKSSMQFIMSMYKSTYPNYKTGRKTEGEKFYKKAVTTLQGLKSKKGIALHEANSIKKNYQNYLLTLDTDSMVGGAQVLAAIFSGDVDSVSALLNADETTIGINAKQIASLYLQFSGRMDALVKGELYEGATDVLDSLY